MKRAIELIRVSTAAQAGDDRASIPAQRVINRKTAQAYGLTIVRSIEMSDVSGASVLQAPEIHELIRLMQSPEIHGVVAREFSRLMRPENYADYALLQVFVDTNTWLYLPEGPINFASTDGRLLGTLRAAMAGVERMDMLKKSWTAKEEKRRRGELANNSNILPYGVTYPWAYTADAEKVREAFRLFLAGETSYTDVGNKVGIPMQNLRIILRNPIYTGWRVIDQKRDMTLAGKRVSKGVDVDQLVELFSVFKEFDLLGRQDKRALLGAINPNVLISNYVVKGISFSLDVNPAPAVFLKAERIYLPLSLAA